MGYDFSTLSPADFEDLARDLIGPELDRRFEAFTAGPDGGIDGRHAKGPNATILQAKHYAGSPFASLKSAMKRERAAIDKLAPGRYILATSCPLTPPNKGALASEIGPALTSEGDIFGPDDLNALLRKYPEIEKAHIKLWLSSNAVLDRVLHAAAHAFTAITADEIKAKVRVYAPNPSFDESKAKLEERHVLIISGPPSVGKTTLGEMLAYAYIGTGWELVAIRSLEDGFAAIVDSKQQIFFFDDFLGKIALDKNALATKDSELARFMKRVRSSPNARFILTTRAYIFEEARRTSEYLADGRLNINRYVLDVGVYTRRIRARILYNHLLVAGTPRSHIEALVESAEIAEIVDHDNYNPRVIEWMTDSDHLSGIAASDYPEAFLAALANPKQLWDTAFRTHIPDKCRHLLLTLFFCSEYSADIDELLANFEALHRHLCERYGLRRDPKDFEEALRILEGSFLEIHTWGVSYVNPSVRDYLSDYLDDENLLADISVAAQTANWADHLWRFAEKCDLTPDFMKRLARSFLPLAERFRQLPIWRPVSGQPYSLSATDSANSDRIKLLLDWWDSTGEERFAALALVQAEHPVSGFTAWRDGSDLVEIVGQLRDGDHYVDFPFQEQLVSHIEAGLIHLLNLGIGADEIAGIADVIEEAGGVLSADVQETLRGTIRREFEDIGPITSEIDSESTLEDHIETLKKLAPRAGVTETELKLAISVIEDRIAEIEEESTSFSPPEVSGSPREPDKFDDDDLRNLFATLIENK